LFLRVLFTWCGGLVGVCTYGRCRGITQGVLSVVSCDEIRKTDVVTSTVTRARETSGGATDRT
jgi:hypothetical protein